MHLEAAKLATYHAASLYDRSSPDHPKHDPSITSHAIGVACNSAKYLAAEAAFTACERSVMSMGGMGYAAEYHVERYMRECFVPRIAPVSRVSSEVLVGGIRTDWLTIGTGDDNELCWREGPEVASKLLGSVHIPMFSRSDHTVSNLLMPNNSQSNIYSDLVSCNAFTRSAESPTPPERNK